MPMGRGIGVNNIRVEPSTTPTHGHCVLSPVSLTSSDQDGGPWNMMIGIYDLTKNRGL